MRPLKLIWELLVRLWGKAPELPSPPSIISMDDIRYDFDTQELRIKIKSPIEITPNPHNTDSMDGAYDVGHSIIWSSHPDYMDIYLVVGTWVWREGQVRVVHQITEVGVDENGWWCKTAGLNTGYTDPYKARQSDIKYVGIGLLWTKFSKNGIWEWKIKE